MKNLEKENPTARGCGGAQIASKLGLGSFQNQLPEHSKFEPEIQDSYAVRKIAERYRLPPFKARLFLELGGLGGDA